jgi:hypothetical protein
MWKNLNHMLSAPASISSWLSLSCSALITMDSNRWIMMDLWSAQLFRHYRKEGHKKKKYINDYKWRSAITHAERRHGFGLKWQWQRWYQISYSLIGCSCSTWQHPDVPLEMPLKKNCPRSARSNDQGSVLVFLDCQVFSRSRICPHSKTSQTFTNPRLQTILGH